MKRLFAVLFLLCVTSCLFASELLPPADPALRADLVKRRAAVEKAIRDDSILIILGNDPKNKNNDVDYPFRQADNLFYLTGITQEDTTLVLVPGSDKRREFIFVKDRNPLKETWTGKILSHEEVTQISGIDNVYSSDKFEEFLTAMLYQFPYDSKRYVESHEFDKFFNAVKAGNASVYFAFAEKPGLERELPKEFELAKKLRDRFVGFTIRDAWPTIRNMRQVKSDYEIQVLRKAVDISCEGHLATWKALKPGMWEFEIQAIMDGVFKSRNADWSYPSIIGSGPNATTLHYEASQRQTKDGELVLMDAAAAYDYYSADVTRTVPVNGKYTQEQKDIYQIVYDAQEAAMKKVKPGIKTPELQAVANDVIKQGLKKLGLITDTSGDQYQMWFLHGLGHWIGLDVHDAGDYWLPTQPGMAFTIEPGIYIREDALDNLPKTPENQKLIDAIRPAFEKYKNIGVRIEDDILVTKDGYENLSEKAPRKIEDIEKFFASR